MSNCVVNGCRSTYKTKHEKCNMFSVPKNEKLKKQWEIAVRRKELKSGQRVCAKHFHKEDIIFKTILFDKNGKKVGESPLTIPKLKNAIPSQFWWNDIRTKFNTLDNDKKKSEVEYPQVMNPSSLQAVTNVLESSAPALEVVEYEHKTSSMFDNLLNAETCIIPPSWKRTMIAISNERFIVYSFTKYVKKDQIICTGFNKSFIIDERCDVQLKINERIVDHSDVCEKNIRTLENFNEALQNFNDKIVCNGVDLDVELLQIDRSRVAYTDQFNTIRHTNCTLLSVTDQCNACKSVKKTIRRKVKRHSKVLALTDNNAKMKGMDEANFKEKYQKLKRDFVKMKTTNDKLQKTNDQLKATLAETHDNISSFDDHVLNGILTENRNNISEEQRNVIKEIFKVSKCHGKNGIRYSDRWIYLCILLHMKSPTTYRFIRENQILPLPCPSTIRKQLSNIKIGCGFDENFFKLFQKYMENKKNKNGLLLIDEIGIRESIRVDAKNLKFIGYEDFGEENLNNKPKEKANHGLVLMFQSLTDSFTQPIAVFASHGPVSGVTLTQLILKAIVALENSGVKIWGVITDGATPNRKFWHEVGVSGARKNLKTHFQHPMDEKRKIYVFSDTPHLIKTVRNRLYEKKSLKIDPCKSSIKWDHFERIYDVEKMRPMHARIIPKITANHLTLNSSSKMRVQLAVQVFSKSMGIGLATYQKFFIDEDFNETIEYCFWINRLFDSLNENCLGIKPSDQKFRIIEESLQILNAWEENLEKNLIQKDEFLTTNTAEGLRVTLTSMLDLIKDYYMINNNGVLTGRINQDSLERFFGSVRQAGGANDHPATPTFLQIYKILSLHRVLKPPKSGNCEVTQVNDQLITLQDLKLIYNNGNDSKTDEIKKQIKKAVSRNEWDAENLLTEHDYYSPDMSTCISYYCMETISSKILKNTTCEECRNAIVNSELTAFIPEACIAINQEEGDSFNHPNLGFFNLILKMEQIFEEYCKNVGAENFVWEDIIRTLVESNILKFPCKNHDVDMLTSIVYQFILIQMYKLAQSCNTLKLKESQEKKKISKFYKN